jgi:hypothetical protein
MSPGRDPAGIKPCPVLHVARRKAGRLRFRRHIFATGNTPLCRLIMSDMHEETRLDRRIESSTPFEFGRRCRTGCIADRFLSRQGTPGRVSPVRRILCINWV